jgi:hypothetical protein
MADDDNKANKKSLELGVPEHGVDPGASGSTFLHIGAFPAADDDSAPPGFKKSLGLARAAGRIGRLNTGGQWNHTDGNRITTTVGNVVDVIQGSYLGYRSSARSPPGPTLSCTWAEWSYSQVGSEDLPIGFTAATPANTAPETTGGDPSATTATDVEVTYAAVNTANPSGYTAGTTTAAATDTSEPTATSTVPLDGDVVSATWAQRVLSYVGSQKTPVSWVYSYTYAYASATYTNAPQPSGVSDIVWAMGCATPSNNSDPPALQQGDILSVSWARRVMSYTGTSSQQVQCVFSETHAGSTTTNTYTSGPNNTYTEATGGNGNVISNTVADSISTAQSAAAITSVNTALTQFNFNFGGGMATVNGVLGQATLNTGGQFTLNLGPQLTYSTPAAVDVVIGEKDAIAIDAAELHGQLTQLAGAISQISAEMNKVAPQEIELVSSKIKLGTTDVDLSTIKMIGP